MCDDVLRRSYTRSVVLILRSEVFSAVVELPNTSCGIIRPFENRFGSHTNESVATTSNLLFFLLPVTNYFVASKVNLGEIELSPAC